MADEPEAERLDTIEDEEGGPVKSFLEHLEDLRWVLIKTIAAAGVAMLACFFAGNHLVKILEWPLKRAPVHKSGNEQTARVFFGTNELGILHAGTNDPLTSLAGTNQHIRLELTPREIVTEAGTNVLLGFTLQPETNAPEAGLPIDIVNLSPTGAFVVATKVAFYGGLVVSSPLIFYFVAQFVFPALRMREKKYIYTGLTFGFGLFLTGVLFCYFVMMPMALAVSAQYAEWFGFKATQWRAEDYIGFVCKFMLGMGLGFEMPVVILTLVKLGILNYRMLAGARRYVIVISFVLGAILTTPEVITQILMAVPLLVLYEVSVWVAWYWERRDRKREQAKL
ncbi:MAG TPA: twin-arginine translocase subunit TatC [Candidatus Dormibacteraeota bacterium]|nr:twin-arginine translocase subunit TatC [Candidatus Dormibacteraeota bacterium]